MKRHTSIIALTVILFSSYALAVSIGLFILNSSSVNAANVTLTGDYPQSVIGIAEPYAASSFTFAFQTPLNPVPPAIVESSSAFIISIMATYTNNDTSRLLDGTAGYFNYHNGYTGVDLRLQNWIGSNWIQIIFTSPYSLYSGESTDPTLLVTETKGPMSFYLNGMGDSDDISVPVCNYSLIPEPATFLLLGLGATIVRKRRYNPLDCRRIKGIIITCIQERFKNH
jgi:hypothetical protein